MSELNQQEAVGNIVLYLQDQMDLDITVPDLFDAMATYGYRFESDKSGAVAEEYQKSLRPDKENAKG